MGLGQFRLEAVEHVPQTDKSRKLKTGRRFPVPSELQGLGREVWIAFCVSIWFEEDDALHIR